MKRLFDILLSFTGILIFSPVFLIVAIAIKINDGGRIFYRQERIGHKGRPFIMFKFRSMVESSGPLLTRQSDDRITAVGKIIRKSKIDELPQLINVLKGDMSFVGPRPEVKKYVDLYSREQAKVLDFKPGITDPASIAYRNEGVLLDKVDNPETYYIKEIMPKKIDLNLKYCRRADFFSDIKIILRTIWLIFSSR